MFNKVILTPKGQQILGEIKKDIAPGLDHSRVEGHSQHPSVDFKNTTESVRYIFSPKGLRSPKDFYKTLVSSKTIPLSYSPSKNPKEVEGVVQRIVSRNGKRNAELKRTISDHLPMLKSDFLTKTLGVGKNNPLYQKSNLMINSMNSELMTTLENCWLKFEESKVNKMMKKFEKFKEEKEDLENELNEKLKKERDDFQMNVMNRDAGFWNQFNSSIKDVENLVVNKCNEEERFEKRLWTYQNNKFRKDWMKIAIKQPSVANTSKPVGRFHKGQEKRKKAIQLVTTVDTVKAIRKLTANKTKKNDPVVSANLATSSKEENTQILTISGQKEFRVNKIERTDIILKSGVTNYFRKSCPINFNENNVE